VHRLIDMAVVGAGLFCLYVAYYRNLFQCALLLARCLFALLVAVALFGPAAVLIGQVSGAAPPYASAVAFFGLWVVVLVAFEPLAESVLRTDGRAMKFEYERAGRVALAVASGFLVSCALSANAVMLPEAEALYFRNDAQPAGALHRKAAWVFTTLTFTMNDPIMPAQMEAGYYWLKEEFEKRRHEGPRRELEDLLARFEKRYGTFAQAQQARERRREITRELRDFLDKWLPQEEGVAGPEGPGKRSEAPSGLSERVGPEAPGSPVTEHAAAPPAMDLAFVQELVQRCEFAEAARRIRDLMGEHTEPPEAERLRRKEARLMRLQRMHADLVRAISQGRPRPIPLAGPSAQATVVTADAQTLWTQDASGQLLKRQWAELEATTLMVIAETYLGPDHDALPVLRDELLLPNSVRVQMLTEELADKDAHIARLRRAEPSSEHALRRALDERAQLLGELFALLKAAGRQHQRRRQQWNPGPEGALEPLSPDALRTALAMQQTVRAAAPALAFLSYEQIAELFGDRLWIHVGGGFVMEYVLLRPGEFMMGSPPGAPYAEQDEMPAHQVSLTRPFYMSVYETTAAQYERVTGQRKGPPRPRLPAVEVLWQEAENFCRVLSNGTGFQVRLPTEAEWEYACRAGSAGPGPAGEKLDEAGWHRDNSGGRLHPCGSRKPNGWGICDMLGNVGEWCSDWYSANYYRSGASRTDPAGPLSGTDRVIRGGTAASKPRDVRPANRFHGHPARSSALLGFRTVILLEP